MELRNKTERTLGLVDRCRRWAIALVAVLLFWGAIDRPAMAENYNRFSLVGADFANQDLRDDDFTKANLRDADFHGSNLAGVRFFAANLEGTNFRGANLQAATLDSARLVNADFSDAVLEGAFAASINIAGIKITGADFTDVILRSDTQDKLCAIAEGTNSQTRRETRETLMCP